MQGSLHCPWIPTCLAVLLLLSGCVEIHSPNDPVVERSGLTSDGVPTFEEVQPILMERCSPCHVGEQVHDCPSTCFASFYEPLVDLYTCCEDPFILFDEIPQNCPSIGQGLTLGDCAMFRVIHFEDDGKDPLPTDQSEIFYTWVEHGMPE